MDLGDAIGGEGAEETNFDAVVGEAAGDELVGLEVAFGGQWDRSFHLAGSQLDGSHAVQVGRGSTFGVPRLPFLVMHFSLSHHPPDVAFPAPLLYFSTFL